MRKNYYHKEKIRSHTSLLENVPLVQTKAISAGVAAGTDPDRCSDRAFGTISWYDLELMACILALGRAMPLY